MVPEILKKLQEKGVTQYRISKACNVWYGAVSLWATGRRTPNATNLKALIEFAKTHEITVNVQ